MPNVVFRPRVTERVPSKTFFAEIGTAPGPHTIGVTGDNSYDTLFGREWLLEWSVEDDMLRLYQESSTHPGEWERVLSPLPPVFDAPLPAGSRRVTFCFDQSARMIVAVEDQQVVKVTRWDSSSQSYVQNVTFAGVDPQLFIDATVADPAGFPEDVRTAVEAGMGVLFEWLPDSSWRESGIPDSDVVLFYLTTDRSGVRARAQRQLYQTVHELHDYSTPVILDRALPLPGAYQLLVSNAAGAPMAKSLVGDPYIGEFMLFDAVLEGLAAAAPPESIVAQAELFNVTAGDELAAAAAPEAVHVDVVGGDVDYELSHELEAGASPEAVAVSGSVLQVEWEEDLSADAGVEDVIVATDVVKEQVGDELSGGVAVESIRVQAVA